MIRRTDRKLTPTAVVCEKHFESSLIERAFSITVNGVVHEIPRDKPRLKPDAIPTIFPEYPKHLVPKVPAKRKTRNLCKQDLELPAKRHRRAQSDASELCSAVESDESESLEGCGDHLNTAAPEECTPRCSSECNAQNDEAQRLQTTCEIRHPFCDLSIPVSWMKVPSPPVESVAYAYCEAEMNNFATLFIEKMVLFEKPLPERQSVTATVYLRGREKSKQVLRTRDEAESLIKDVSLTALCGGCGLKPASKSTLPTEACFLRKNARYLRSLMVSSLVFSASTKEFWLKTKPTGKRKGRRQAQESMVKRNTVRTFLAIVENQETTRNCKRTGGTHERAK
ncbi:hypothetical protein HPB49_026596 [Dermacentor silvarum]|nr:hypothetical protein HPB49_026596 [Dermacentor silvarum]